MKILEHWEYKTIQFESYLEFLAFGKYYKSEGWIKIGWDDHLYKLRLERKLD